MRSVMLTWYASTVMFRRSNGRKTVPRPKLRDFSGLKILGPEGPRQRGCISREDGLARDDGAGRRIGVGPAVRLRVGYLGQRGGSKARPDRPPEGQLGEHVDA